jgi:hypothetical protein
MLTSSPSADLPLIYHSSTAGLPLVELLNLFIEKVVEIFVLVKFILHITCFKILNCAYFLCKPISGLDILCFTSLFEATALRTVDIKMTLGHFICTVGIISNFVPSCLCVQKMFYHTPHATSLLCIYVVWFFLCYQPICRKANYVFFLLMTEFLYVFNVLRFL